MSSFSALWNLSEQTVQKKTYKDKKKLISVFDW